MQIFLLIESLSNKTCRMSTSETTPPYSSSSSSSLEGGGPPPIEISWEDWRDYLILSPEVESLPEILTYWRHTYLDVGEDTTIPDDFTETEMNTGMWWRHLYAFFIFLFLVAMVNEI